VAGRTEAKRRQLGSIRPSARQATKWRCPTAECAPARKWIQASRLHTLIPRGTGRWNKLYRQRGAVERDNGRLKHK
jgi:hypothetical protein